MGKVSSRPAFPVYLTFSFFISLFIRLKEKKFKKSFSGTQKRNFEEFMIVRSAVGEGSVQDGLFPSTQSIRLSGTKDRLRKEEEKNLKALLLGSFFCCTWVAMDKSKIFFFFFFNVVVKSNYIIIVYIIIQYNNYTSCIIFLLLSLSSLLLLSLYYFLLSNIKERIIDCQ